MPAPRVELVHLTSPLCSWSWGYEPVVNRVEMLFGKQIDLVTPQGLPYTSREKWLEDYEMSDKEAIEFQRDIVASIGVPCYVPHAWSELPASCYPASVAVTAAALAYGPREERRLSRQLMFATFVEGLDTSDEKVLQQVVERTGLDNGRLLKMTEGDAVDRAMANDMHRGGHHANFYSLIVRQMDPDDGTKHTMVSLGRAYDPERVERALDFMAGRKLKRAKLWPIEKYVAEWGPVSIPEVAKVYGLSKADAKTRLVALEKKGLVQKRTFPKLPGVPWWGPVARSR